jgi:branched-chain amino acid aminotransferase
MIESLDIIVKRAEKSGLPHVDFNNLVFGRIFSDHMFVADYIDKEWKNLEVCPYHNISISPAMMALHYGQSIFEGMKAYRTIDNRVVLFRPRANFERINQSAARMCMTSITEDVFLGGLSKLLEIDKDWVPTTENSSLYIRPFMFASDEFIGMKPSESYKFMIFSCPVGAYYAEPVRVKIESYYSRAVEGGTGGAKTAGNYAASLYPAKLAQQQGYHQLIWTDAKEHLYIEESGTMNLLFKIDGKIITPPAGETILNGITRNSILQIAKDWGVTIEERKVSVVEVMESIQNGTLEEAFGVGTAATVSPIKTIAYQGVDYDLPALSEDGFALKAKQYLMDLCRGKIEDKHNWIYTVV